MFAAAASQSQEAKPAGTNERWVMLFCQSTKKEKRKKKNVFSVKTEISSKAAAADCSDQLQEPCDGLCMARRKMSHRKGPSARFYCSAYFFLKYQRFNLQPTINWVRNPDPEPLRIGSKWLDSSGSSAFKFFKILFYQNQQVFLGYLNIIKQWCETCASMLQETFNKEDSWQRGRQWKASHFISFHKETTVLFVMFAISNINYNGNTQNMLQHLSSQHIQIFHECPSWLWLKVNKLSW